MTYTVVIPNMNQLQILFAKAPDLAAREIETAVNQSTLVLQASAKTYAPIDQGRLRSSILRIDATRYGSVIEGGVGTAVKYSEWMERGTGIYGPAKTPIRPKTKRVLSFMVGNKRVFAREVKGVKGHFYMERAVKDNQARINGFFEAAARRVVTKLAGGLS